MISLVAKNILRFAFLILLQGLVVSRLDSWHAMILPSVYLFAILMLPIETPRLLVLIIAFITGICVDAFSNTLGMHASACVLIGFLQPVILRLIAPRDGYEFGQHPTLQDFGLAWYLTYAGILAFVHHLWLFFIEQLSLSDFLFTMGKVTLSSIAAVFLMVLGQYLILSNSSKRPE